MIVLIIVHFLRRSLQMPPRLAWMADVLILMRVWTPSVWCSVFFALGWNLWYLVRCSRRERHHSVGHAEKVKAE